MFARQTCLVRSLRVTIETWFHPLRSIVKKCFLSDHFHVYSVLTFCLAGEMKKNLCLHGVYLSARWSSV